MIITYLHLRRSRKEKQLILLKHSDDLVIHKIGTPAKKLEFCINFIYPIITDKAVLDYVGQEKKRKEKRTVKTHKNLYFRLHEVKLHEVKFCS